MVMVWAMVRCRDAGYGLGYGEVQGCRLWLGQGLGLENGSKIQIVIEQIEPLEGHFFQSKIKDLFFFFFETCSREHYIIRIINTVPQAYHVPSAFIKVQKNEFVKTTHPRARTRVSFQHLLCVLQLGCNVLESKDIDQRVGVGAVDVHKGRV